MREGCFPPVGFPMNEADALAEARRRWGERGAVWAYPEDYPPEFRVGIMTEKKRHWLGRGTTYQNAFDDADRRAKRTVES